MTTATIQHLNALINEVERMTDEMGANLLHHQNCVRSIYDALRDPSQCFDGQIHTERMDDWELDLAALLLLSFSRNLAFESKGKPLNSNHVVKALEEMEAELKRASAGQTSFFPQVQNSYELAMAACNATVDREAGSRVFVKAMAKLQFKAGGNGFG